MYIYIYIHMNRTAAVIGIISFLFITGLITMLTPMYGLSLLLLLCLECTVFVVIYSVASVLSVLLLLGIGCTVFVVITLFRVCCL